MFLVLESDYFALKACLKTATFSFCKAALHLGKHEHMLLAFAVLPTFLSHQLNCQGALLSTAPK